MSRRVLSTFGMLLLLLSLLASMATGAPAVTPVATQSPEAGPPLQQPAVQPRVTTATDGAISKIHPNLRESALSGTESLIAVNVFLKADADASAIVGYFDRPIVRTIAGVTSVVGQVPANLLIKLASSEAVDVVLDPQPYTPPPNPVISGAVELRSRAAANIQARREGRTLRSADEVERGSPEGWWDVGDGHRSSSAWANGYTGQGVWVGVMDSGVDFAHPDLQGTWAVYPLTSTTIPTPTLAAYGGWPVAFDDYSMLLYALSGGPAAGTWYVDTSFTATAGASGTIVFDAKTYTVPLSSVSGVYHLGYHPDPALSAWWWGEPVATLVVDENADGAYDTVYVDLDDNYDFTDEKPVTREAPISWKDLDDGLADLSGGMVYFIADGWHHPPGFDWLWAPYVEPFAPPAAGNMVAFMINDPTFSDHGQLCASSIVGQGVIDGEAPAYKPGGAGGLVQGGGREAEVVAMGNYYQGGYATDNYLFAALGYDGIPQSGDEVQILSMSFGDSTIDNDVWDWESRFLTWMNLALAPNLSLVGATGNGGPGYGTVFSPAPVTGISAGGSTQFGSCGGPWRGFEPITSTNQLLWGDVVNWSNSGLSADGAVGVSLIANAAYGTGDLALNEWGDGWTAWGCWGGTSRAAPTIAGNLALVYDAYYQAHGVYPTWDVARALLMSGATDVQNDTFRQGAGMLNAERSTWVAAGDYGFYAMPDTWSAGDYRGDDWASFAHIVHPGGTASQSFTLYNDSPYTITADLADGSYTLMGTEEWTLTTNNAIEQIDIYKPDYLITATQWVEAYAEADLMIVSVALPYGQFSVGDPAGLPAELSSSWYLTLYDWTDVNGDGNLWTDLNSDGAVQWGEIDDYEYNRYSYYSSYGTTMQQSVHDPANRYHDGIFVVLQHTVTSTAVPTSTLGVQVSFYQRADWSWLDPGVATLEVPANGAASFTATLTVPLTAPLGLYEGEILATDPGTATYPAHTTVIPVAANVAAEGYSFAFGDVDQPTLYDNGNVYGFFDWGATEEDGDWRFFSTDVPDDYGLPEGTSLLVHTTWRNYPTDLDTLVFGPAMDDFSDPGGAFYLPDTFGPYTLEPLGGSERANVFGGIWLFRTNTGTTEEWVTAPLQAGLQTIALHNVLYNPDPGTLTEVPFSGEVGTLAVGPNPIELWTAQTAGSVDMAADTSMALPGLAVSAYGLSQPLLWSSVPLTPTVERCDWTYEFTATSAGYIEVSTSSPDISDNDLYLHQWDGTDWVLIALSSSWTASEYVRVTLPPDGRYRVCIDDFSEEAGHFDMTLFAPAGDQLWLTGVPTGTLDPGQQVSFTLQYSATMTEGDWYGVVFAGPPAAPGTLLIPVTIHYALFRAYLPLIAK